MSRLISNWIVLSTTIAFVASLPQRHLRLDPLPIVAPAISAPSTKKHVDAWYKAGPILNLGNLPEWTPEGSGDDSASDGYVKPAWGMFAATSALAIYSILDDGCVAKALMPTATMWSVVVIWLGAVVLYLRTYGLRYSLRLLFAVVTLLGLLFGFLRML